MIVEDFKSLEMHLPKGLYEMWKSKLLAIESPSSDSISVAETALKEVERLYRDTAQLIQQVNELYEKIEARLMEKDVAVEKAEALAKRNELLEERLTLLKKTIETAYHHLEYGTKSARRLLEEVRE